MTTPTAVVRVSSPAALLSVVAQLLGFMPENSLVVIGLAPPRDRIRVTLRYELHDPPCQGVSEDVAGHAVGVLDGQGLTTMVAVAYGPDTLAASAATALLNAAEEAGIKVHEFLRVQDGRYWSYVCTSEVCCPVAGVPFEVTPDPELTGGPVLSARAALAASVAPVDGITRESMRQATRQAEQHTAQLLKSADRGAARHMIAAEGLAEVGAMIARYQDGGGFTTDDEIARITVALRDLRVRDDAWAGWTRPSRPRTSSCGPMWCGGRSPATWLLRRRCSPSWPGSPATARSPTWRSTGPWPTTPGTRWPCCCGRSSPPEPRRRWPGCR